MNKFLTLLYTCLAIVISTPILSQVQIGMDINGEAPGDLFGFEISMSADGNRLVVGTPVNGVDGENSGQVRIFDWNGLEWTQLGDDLNGELAGDQFGYAVSLSADGNRLAVSAPGVDASTGLVRVYQWNGMEWTQLGNNIDGEEVGDNSGFWISMAADGGHLAVSTPLNSENGLIAGHARVFNWNGTEWTQMGTDIDGRLSGEQLGHSNSLSADGSILAIGIRFSNGNSGNAGQVRIYQWDGSDWVQKGNDINGEAAADQCGWSVSLSSDGNRLATGAPINDGNGNKAGHVRVYDWNGTNWVQLGSDIDGIATGDWLGHSVSLSADGSLLAVGAPEKDGEIGDGGYTLLYNWNGSEWAQVGVQIDGEAEGDESGFRVSLSGDGSRLAVSAISNDGNGENSGHVRVFSDFLSSTNYATPPAISIFPNPVREGANQIVA